MMAKRSSAPLRLSGAASRCGRSWSSAHRWFARSRPLSSRVTVSAPRRARWLMSGSAPARIGTTSPRRSPNTHQQGGSCSWGTSQTSARWSSSSLASTQSGCARAAWPASSFPGRPRLARASSPGSWIRTCTPLDAGIGSAARSRYTLRVSPSAGLQLRTLVLCDHAITAQDGKISAIGIFGQISVARLPAVHPRLFIVAVLDAEPGPHELQLQVLSPQGAHLLVNPPQMHLEGPAGTTTANIVADLNGLELKELGRHEVELREGDRILGRTPLQVSLLYQGGGPA